MPVVDTETSDAANLWKTSLRRYIRGITFPLWDWRTFLTEEETFALMFSRLYESCFGGALDTATSQYVRLIRKMDSLLDQVRLMYRNPDGPAVEVGFCRDCHWLLPDCKCRMILWGPYHLEEARQAKEVSLAVSYSLKVSPDFGCVLWKERENG